MQIVNRLVRTIIIFIAGMIFFISACGDNMNLDSMESGKIVVNGFLSPTDTFRINVSYVKNMWGYSPDSFISNAKLILTLPDQSKINMEYDSMKISEELFSNKRKGFYKALELVPYSQGLYTLSLETPDKKLIIAHDSIPAAVPIKEAKFFFDTINNIYQLQFQFSDLKVENRYYAVSFMDILHHNTQIFIESNHELSSPNTFIEAQIFAPLNQLIFSNKTFEAGDQMVNINFYYFKENLVNWDSTEFVIQLHSISKAYYDYAISFYKQNQAEKDFYAEPVSVFSNIEGGYGIFAGYNTSEAKVVYSNVKNE
jgi:hypothetical protein